MDDLDAEKARELIEQLVERFPALTNDFKNLGIAAKKGTVDFTKTLKDLNRDVEKGRASFKRIVNSIESLDDAIEELGSTAADGAKRSKLLQQREELVKLAADERTKEASIKFGKSLTNGATKLTADLTKSLQSGASSTEISSKILTAGIDLVAGVTGGLLGAIPIVGGFLKGVTEATSALAKFAVNVFSVELEKTVKAFHDISTGGAVFADGMTGMRNAAKDASLTLEDFAGVIKRQSLALGAAGLSVPEAVKKMGGALSAGGDAMRNNLLNLGYRIEEHGDLVAETMMQMRQQGGPLRASNAVVAAETQKYAENLRVISAITGEDAKSRAKAAQEQANQLAFQQKLAALPEKQRGEVMRAYENANTLTRKNFMDLVNFGSVINTQGAIITAQLPAQKALQDGMYAAYKDRTLNEFSMRDLQKANNDKIRQQALDQYGGMGAIGTAAAAGVEGIVGSIAELVMGLVKDLSPAEAISEAERLAKKQMETTDELTTNMNKAAIAAKELAVSMQDALLKLLPDATKINLATLEAFQKVIDNIMGNGPVVPDNQQIGKAGLAAGMGGIGDMSLGLADQLQLGAGISPKITEIKGNAMGAGISPKITEIKGNAMGGIKTGPVSGYSEVLHGTEAVVPLPDNKSIPVSLDSSSITASINQQTGVLAEILRAMQSTNSLTSQIAQNSY
jgi:hypothetical protein